MNPARDGRIWRIIRLDALLGITITGIVFDTILASQVHHRRRTLGDDRISLLRPVVGTPRLAVPRPTTTHHLGGGGRRIHLASSLDHLHLHPRCHHGLVPLPVSRRTHPRLRHSAAQHRSSPRPGGCAGGRLPIARPTSHRITYQPTLTQTASPVRLVLVSLHRWTTAVRSARPTSTTPSASSRTSTDVSTQADRQPVSGRDPQMRCPWSYR